MLARLFASGLKAKAVASRSGYSINRVVTLHNDPAFQELIAQYRQMVDESFVENVDTYMELATGNMLKAERMIADKLDKADEIGEGLPTRELVSISRDAADRFGYGKRETKFNVNVDFAAALDKAIKRSGKVIELHPTARSLPPTAPSGPALEPRTVQDPPLSGARSPSSLTPNSHPQVVGERQPIRRRI